MADRYLHPLAGFLNLFEMSGLLTSFDGEAFTEVRHLSFDTRDLRAGTLFFCKGAHFKEEYLVQAAANGAVAYVSEKRYESVSIPCVIVSDIRRAMCVAALFHYDHPAEKLKTVGISPKAAEGIIRKFYGLPDMPEEKTTPAGKDMLDLEALLS